MFGAIAKTYYAKVLGVEPERLFVVSVMPCTAKKAECALPSMVGEDGTPDAMNAAWGGVADRSRIAMYLSGGHKTVKNILKRGAFTVSMGDAEHAAACDYVGIESGNSVPDKVARAGFHVTKSEHVDAPMIDELPLALECKLVSYDEETELLLGEVVNVSVDERALDENGKLAVEKLHVITFDYANHGYYVLGEKVASAFEDGKKFK